jgi:hypothetical protein
VATLHHELTRNEDYIASSREREFYQLETSIERSFSSEIFQPFDDTGGLGNIRKTIPAVADAQEQLDREINRWSITFKQKNVEECLEHMKIMKHLKHIWMSLNMLGKRDDHVSFIKI